MDRVLAAIDAALVRKGLSDAAASKLAVGNVALIKNMRSARGQEKRYSFQALEQLARVLDLECYFGPPRDSSQAQEADPSEFVRVPVYDVRLAAGPGAANAEEPVIDHLAFRRDWLRGLGVAPSSAVIATARGESMAPTIRDGDMVLVDTASAAAPARPRAPADRRPPRIFALLDDGAARIKRLDLAAPGTLALLSDNPQTPPEFRPAASVRIIGRVVWWGHTNRE